MDEENSERETITTKIANRQTTKDPQSGCYRHLGNIKLEKVRATAEPDPWLPHHLAIDNTNQFYDTKLLRQPYYVINKPRRRNAHTLYKANPS